MDSQRIQAYFNPGSQLVEALGISDNPSSQEYLQFLMEVLRATASSEGDSEVIYPLLKANLDKLDDNFIAVLQNWAGAKLSEVELSAAEDLARVIFDFGELMVKFPFGKEEANLEISLVSYEISLTVFTRDSHSETWAKIQNSLGIAYRKKLNGDRTKNIESALAAYQRALEIRTKEAFPTDWAMTQSNVGNAYSQRIQGDRAENIESALAAYQRALEVRTKEALPTDWARTQNNLGYAYSKRIKGDRAENIESALAAYQRALEVRTQEALPSPWALTQHNLGNAYSKRIKGDRAENIESALAAYQRALEVRTQEDFPINWAFTQHNLGDAYSHRILGDRSENLEKALAAYQRALEVITKEDFAADWAFAQHNLGYAYSHRILGDRSENLELAIAAYQRALEIHTSSAFPTDWARTQNNLGIAYSDRILGDRTENLEEALTAYQRALEIRTQEAFPTDWAMTQNNLGNAYSDRILGDRTENIESAIAAYQQALEIYTPEADPIECLRTSRNLGNLHFTEGNWQPAIDAYEKAITAVELRRSWASTDDRRQKIIAEAIEVYQKLVQAYINTEQWDKAIETVERSKARNLVELLTNRDLYPKGDVPQETIDQLDRLRHGLPSLERQLQIVIDRIDRQSRNTGESEEAQPSRQQSNEIDRISRNTGESEEAQRRGLEESREHLRQELQFSRQQLNEILDRIKRDYDSSFSLTQKVEQIRFSDIQCHVDDRAAIIEWYITGDKIVTFIVTLNSQHPHVEQTDHGELEALASWQKDYFAAYYQEKKRWRADLASNLKQLAEILKIDDILAQIDSMFDQQGKKCDRLILIPHRVLHMLPLHAMPLENGDLLCDRFSRGIGYTPSSQLLQLTQTQQRPDFQNLFAIQDPEEDLAYGFLEVEIIRSRFPSATVLASKAAREADVKTHPELSDAHCIHFSCHGEFNPESPLESALRLAEAERPDSGSPEDGYLTLAEIFALQLRKSRLVTLSACETAMADPKSISDEYISLPSGFLFAGSPSVVCSQWTVSQFSTSFLTIEFYKRLKQLPLGEAGTVALALNQAQKWLRNLTSDECEAFLNSLEAELDIDQLSTKERERVEAAIKGARKQIRKRGPHPFANLYYWAAFTATGF